MSIVDRIAPPATRRPNWRQPGGVPMRCLGLAGTVIAAVLLFPCPAYAASSTHEHTARGDLAFGCGLPTVNLRIAGSEASGYRAVILVAEVGATSYYAGTGFLSGVAADVTYEDGRFVAV